MKRIALFPGSFDPFTNGHYDVVMRGAKLFDEVIVAIGNNSSKQRYIPVGKMHDVMVRLFANQENIQVQTFKGLTAEFARQVGAQFLLRGLRINGCMVEITFIYD